jgi:hypothetical protein
MYGLTRGTVTLLGAAVAGLLVWISTQVSDTSTSGYWAVYGLIAAAGLVMAFSQLLGGWTKWGLPRLSINVLLIAFIPTLIAAGWVVVAHQPHPNWFRNHVLNWSNTEYVSVLAFGIGLVFGFSFDTAGPSDHGPFGRRRRAAAVPAGGAARTTDDDAAAPTAREQAAARDDARTSRTRVRNRDREPAQRQ